MPIHGPKFRNLGGSKKKMNFFDISKSAVFGPANGQSVTYPKIQTKVCRVPSGTPMDWFLMKSANAEYPLSCRKCVEKRTICTRIDATPPEVHQTPPKMVPPYSPAICPPKTSRTLWWPVAPSSRKNWFSEGPIFWQKYSNGPGVAKNWHMSKWTKRGPRTCHKLSWDQIWQKNSKGKCPKLPIRNSHAPCYKVV